MQLRIDQPTTDRIDQQVSYTIDYQPTAPTPVAQITKIIAALTGGITKQLSPATQITT